MYKALILYFLLLLCTGCSVSLKPADSDAGERGKLNLETLRAGNLANNSFYIQKLEIETITKEGKENIFASVKFSKPDTFLISVRLRSGIEAARVFLTRDTLLINDRIHKTLYFGSGDALRTKYGYSSGVIHLLLGAYIEELLGKEKIIGCENGLAIRDLNVEGHNVTYSIDCKRLEIRRIDLDSDSDSKHVIINFSVPEHKAGFTYFKKIQISNFMEFDLIKMGISRIDVPYEGKIEFIPGKNYDLSVIK